VPRSPPLINTTAYHEYIRPPKRLAKLRSVSHALFLILQKHRSKTSKLTKFVSLHFRDNCGWPWTYGGSCVVHLFKQEVASQKTIFLLTWHFTTIFFVKDSLITFSAQIVHSHMNWGKICLKSFADQTYAVEKKCSQSNIMQNQLESFYLTKILQWELNNSYTCWCSVI